MNPGAREVDTAVQSAVDSQMSAVDDAGADGPLTLADMFGTGGASFKGIAAGATAGLPANTVTEQQAAAMLSAGCSVPPGVRGRGGDDEPTGVGVWPHVPPAVHRRLAVPARGLPALPWRRLGSCVV
jgi:hypothetical protein